MPFADVNGARIHYEESGEGPPVVWSHEFAGDHRSWAAQVEHFDRFYRNVVYDHRGYPPSSVPEDAAAYGEDLLVADLLGLMDHLGVERAHLVGLSMGASVVLNFALAHPGRCRGIVVAGCGTGSSDREAFERMARATVALLRERGMAEAAREYARSPTRLPLLRKSPGAYARFVAQLSEHSALGSALTFENVQLRRPSVFALEDRLRALRVPALLVVGDEDEPCIDSNVFMKRRIPSAGLLVLPNTGHAVNLEEPAAFNAAVADFFGHVERGRWPLRVRSC
jgi:pimeloyl-ACP methyl ester carboxylesterase